MKYDHKPSRGTLRARRMRAYLEAWPINAQLEAIFEDKEGRPQKLDTMKADFARIKREHPIDG